MATSRPPLPKNFIADTVRGFVYPLEAIPFISKNRLWPLTVVAIAVNAVLLVALCVATIFLIVPWLDDLDTWLQRASDTTWVQSLLGALSWLIWIIAIPLALAANALLLVLIGQAVASPFLDKLSERTEEIVLGRTAPGFSVGGTVKSVVMALSDLVWSIILLAVVNLPIMLVAFLLPVVGTAIGAAASFAFTALLLSQEFMTMPLARQLVPFRQRFGYVWRNKWLAFGFGVSAMGIMLVPGLNIVLLPLAACGGTLACCDLESSGRLQRPEREQA